MTVTTPDACPQPAHAWGRRRLIAGQLSKLAAAGGGFAAQDLGDQLRVLLGQVVERRFVGAARNLQLVAQARGPGAITRGQRLRQLHLSLRIDLC